MQVESSGNPTEFSFRANCGSMSIAGWLVALPDRRVGWVPEPCLRREDPDARSRRWHTTRAVASEAAVNDLADKCEQPMFARNATSRIAEGGHRMRRPVLHISEILEEVDVFHRRRRRYP